MEQNPSRLVKEKNVLLSRLRHVQLHYLAEQHERKKNSIKICPPCEFFIPLPCKDFTTNLESPSKTKLLKLVYIVKITARLAASNSKISIDDGFLIFSERATITSLSKFQITTPIPALYDSPNIAPSKLVFKFSKAQGLYFVHNNMTCYSWWSIKWNTKSGT